MMNVASNEPWSCVIRTSNKPRIRPDCVTHRVRLLPASGRRRSRSLRFIREPCQGQVDSICPHFRHFACLLHMRSRRRLIRSSALSLQMGAPLKDYVGGPPDNCRVSGPARVPQRRARIALKKAAVLGRRCRHGIFAFLFCESVPYFQQVCQLARRFHDPLYPVTHIVPLYSTIWVELLATHICEANQCTAPHCHAERGVATAAHIIAKSAQRLQRLTAPMLFQTTKSDPSDR